ncbi:MAG TPA: hypothetical protein VJ850_05745 [Candidatus Limnocylindrales bacterium]|nr:hypothetical protein [Candidatus Limnocylindrales bacterium]
MPAPRDTSRDFWARQVAAYRAMGPDARLRRAFELTEFVRAVARDAIRDTHPEWPSDQVDAELKRRRR